ncbi:MAG: DUF1636 domain-containing protein [Burkholderiaceae bacterium]
MTELIICTTCRPAGHPRDQQAPGERLLEIVQATQAQDGAQAWSAVRPRGMACMAVCTRACSVAFQAPGKHTYLFGDLTPDEDTARQLLDCAALHARAADGSLVRDQRPERLRRGMLARLPPSGQAPTAGAPSPGVQPVSETP